MSELKVLHEHSIVMHDTNKKREFFVALYCGDLSFNVKEGCGTTTVFELTKKQFLEIAKKLENKKCETCRNINHDNNFCRIIEKNVEYDFGCIRHCL
jgi:hypothetical protein